MSEITPGPWSWNDEVWADYNPAESAPWLVDANGNLVLSGVIRCKSEQDARLIAAAPDLLAVLERASHINGFREFNDYLPTIRAAIAKATGTCGEHNLYTAPQAEQLPREDEGQCAPRAHNIYEIYTANGGWDQVSKKEYDEKKDRYVHRIRLSPTSERADADTAGANKAEAVEHSADWIAGYKKGLSDYESKYAGAKPVL